MHTCPKAQGKTTTLAQERKRLNVAYVLFCLLVLSFRNIVCNLTNLTQQKRFAQTRGKHRAHNDDIHYEHDKHGFMKLNLQHENHAAQKATQLCIVVHSSRALRRVENCDESRTATNREQAAAATIRSNNAANRYVRTIYHQSH